MVLLHMHLVSFILLLASSVSAQLPGKWEVLVENAGISSMHTAVTHKNTVVLLDRTNNGPTRLPCRPAAPVCTAHSALFDLTTNTVTPLTIITDTWCSSGQFLPDGTLLQSGGAGNGTRKFRRLVPCNPNLYHCDWEELEDPVLTIGRWYATNQVLPDGSIIIIGGIGTHTVEFYPPKNLREFGFLAETEDYKQTDNLYPFVHLLPDGNLFVFANTAAVLYNPTTGAVVHRYPTLPGGPRNYPSAGSSVMLAISADDDFRKAEVIVCGGAKYGAFLHHETTTPAEPSCGRILATEATSTWAVEDMPIERIMGDMVMLPTGEVLIINGAKAGSQGFGYASNPCLNPVLYRPEQPVGLRFMLMTPTTIPRMYHSTAVLLPDGRVLVAGSNTHYVYVYGVEFPTELRLEAFSPEYLDADKRMLRPKIEAAPMKLRYGSEFDIDFALELPLVGGMEVNMASSPFVTHSFSQGQRLVKLKVSSEVRLGLSIPYRYRVVCKSPPNGNVAPPGYYMVFAINQGVPSVAKWVQLVF